MDGFKSVLRLSQREKEPDEWTSSGWEIAVKVRDEGGGWQMEGYWTLLAVSQETTISPRIFQRICELVLSFFGGQ